MVNTAYTYLHVVNTAYNYVHVLHNAYMYSHVTIKLSRTKDPAHTHLHRCPACTAVPHPRTVHLQAVACSWCPALLKSCRPAGTLPQCQSTRLHEKHNSDTATGALNSTWHKIRNFLLSSFVFKNKVIFSQKKGTPITKLH